MLFAMGVSAILSTFVPMSMRKDMHAQVDAKADKQDGGYIAYPFLYRVQLVA